jgi:hypothetical protein
MIRSAIRSSVQENLDDSAMDKWTAAQLDRILDRVRRWTYALARSQNPKIRNRVGRTITTVIGTREYDLDEDDLRIISVERIAVAGATLTVPVPWERVDFRDRLDFDPLTVGQSGSQGKGIYYITEDINTTLTARPKKKIGFIPTPSVAGADFTVWTEQRPDASWGTAGDGTEDTYDSGLPKEWEDLLVVKATIDALMQKPPKEGNSLSEWKQELVRQMEILKISDTGLDSSKRKVRVVE